MIIVIDGPAGAGKSTTARAVAKKLAIEYIDSGALYRAATLLFIESTDEETFLARLEQQPVSFRYVKEQFEVCINGHNVTSKLRKAEVAEKVSTVAAMPHVRSFVNDLMRRMIKSGLYIAEGRDLGTAVFPDADVKFFMKADITERVHRRYLELQNNGVDTTIEDVRQHICHRDETDKKRENDPLKKAPDAVVIDTTDMQFDKQVQEIALIVKEKLNLNIKL